MELYYNWTESELYRTHLNLKNLLIMMSGSGFFLEIVRRYILSLIGLNRASGRDTTRGVTRWPPSRGSCDDARAHRRIATRYSERPNQKPPRMIADGTTRKVHPRTGLVSVSSLLQCQERSTLIATMMSLWFLFCFLSSSPHFLASSCCLIVNQCVNWLLYGSWCRRRCRTIRHRNVWWHLFLVAPNGVCV